MTTTPLILKSCTFELDSAAELEVSAYDEAISVFKIRTLTPLKPYCDAYVTCVNGSVSLHLKPIRTTNTTE